MFFSVEDVNNGVMDNRIKLVQKKQWRRHDDESCTVFHYFSELRKSHCIKNLFNDVCVGTKTRKFPLPVMDMSVCVLGSVCVLTFFRDPLPELY
jgi:hypothetical protein